MSIAEGNPDSGVRIVLHLEQQQQQPHGGPAGPSRYVGEVLTKTDRRPLVAVVGADDAIEIQIEGADEDLAERVRLLVRTVVRHARSDGRPLPRSIQRWRP